MSQIKPKFFSFYGIELFGYVNADRPKTLQGWSFKSFMILSPIFYGPSSALLIIVLALSISLVVSRDVIA